MKKSILILILVIVAFSIGTIVYVQYDQDSKAKAVYVLSDPVKDTKLNWAQYDSLFPADFEQTESIMEIKELLKLNEQQREMYDSIKSKYYS